MLSLAVGEYRLTVTNDPPHYDGSADNVHNYDVTHSFDGDSCAATSGHALRLFQHDHQIRSALLSASGGASGVHDHTAIIIDGRNCIIAVGPYMASVSIPSLNLNWAEVPQV
jgi:hypothetical protein